MNEAPLIDSGLVFTAEVIDAPPPVDVNSGIVREQMIKLLARMRVRQCVEVDRPISSVKFYIAKFRKHYAEEKKFTVRRNLKNGKTRVWRTV